MRIDSGGRSGGRRGRPPLSNSKPDAIEEIKKELASIKNSLTYKEKNTKMKAKAEFAVN